MKYAIVENNKVTGFAVINQPFYLNGNKYSARFIRDMSEEQCLEIGLYNFVEGTKPDLRFYWESEPSYSIDDDTKTVTESYSLNPRIFDDREEVDEDGNPDYQGIDTSFLVATLTAAIQEQQAIITTLTARIETLEGK